MEFSVWITNKFVEWRGKRVGRGSSIADFAGEFGASQQVMSGWMRPGSKHPKAPKYLNALHERYGDEFLQVLGIKKEERSEITLDQLPPELRSLLETAITELNAAYAAEGVLPDTPRALELARSILGKHGFNVTMKSKENSG